MPEIVLARHEAKGNLPDACMCCGEPATTWITRTFLARAPEVPGPSVFMEVFAVRLLLATANVPRFHLRTSFCEQHRHYWTLRAGLLFGGLAGMAAVLVLGGLTVVYLMTVQKVDAPWLSCCVIVPFLLFLVVWIIPTMRLRSTSIRARRAKDGGVLLMNVGERYVAAVRAARRTPPPLPDWYDPTDKGD
jgi:hypothetical protein